MKKILALILCAVLALSFASCASFRSYEEIEADGKLVVATNATFPPYEFRDDNGNFAGIDIEIIQAVGEYLGLEVEITDIEFDAIITSVSSGKADIGIAGGIGEGLLFKKGEIVRKIKEDKLIEELIREIKLIRSKQVN